MSECIEASKSKPKVSETISHYVQTIYNYTHQNKMTKNLIELLANNKDFYNSIDELNRAYNVFRNNINEKFWDKLKQIRPNDWTICKIENNIEVKYLIKEDNEGFFYGFYIEQNGKRIQESNDTYIKLADILKGISPTFNKNQIYIGWTFSNIIVRKFFSFNKERIFELNNETEMDKLVHQIVGELDRYIDEIKTSLSVKLV